MPKTADKDKYCQQSLHLLMSGDWGQHLRTQIDGSTESGDATF